MADRRATLRLGLLLVWGVVVAGATLIPTQRPSVLTLESFFCVYCGWGSTADMIRNWALFVPFGALAGPPLGMRRALGWATILTIAIEAAQLAVPGRDPALRDLVFNVLGAATGAGLARSGLPRAGELALSLMVAVTWLAPTLLLAPATTARDVYGQWTPSLASVETYRGRVLEATFGGFPVHSGLLPNKAMVDSALTGRRPVELLVSVGPAPTGYAPVFQVVDAEHVSLMSIGILGEDLILRGGNRAEGWGLDQPDARWAGAIRGLARGDTVRVVVDRGSDSICMSVESRSRCGLAPSLGDGWSHLMHLAGLPGGARTLLAVGWALCLGILLGTTASTAGAALVRSSALAVVGLIAASISPDVRADVVHALVLAFGGPLGTQLRPRLRHIRLEVLLAGGADRVTRP